MSREKEVFYEYLRSKGLKRTAQRDAVLDLFLATEAHQSAEAIYAKIRQSHPSIGYSTVYRTLKLLKACDLAREVYFADGRMHFEHQFEHPHHDHMVCTECGLTIEFCNETIEALQEQVAADNRFTPTRHTMVIFGRCEACEAQRQEARVLG